MTTAELIKRLGSDLGVYGVAVHAYIEANPGCRYDQIIAGLSMSKAQVHRTVAKLEEVGAVLKDKGDTDIGTSRPTVLRCVSQTALEMSVSPSETPIITTASDKEAVNMGVSQVHTVSQGDPTPESVSTTETPINIDTSLSDAGNYGCLSRRQAGVENHGTKVAPLSAETTTRNTPPSPSAQEGDAYAPPSPPKKVRKSSAPKAEGPMAKLSDPERVVLDAWRELTKAYPPEYAWPTIFERILDGFDAARFKRCGGAYLTHIGRGQRYVGGVLDWYVRNQTEPERNGNGKVATGQFGKPEVTRDFTKWPRRAG